MAKKAYLKLKEAPEGFQPEVEVGEEFEADYDEDQARALVAAGWCEPAKKKGDK